MHSRIVFFGMDLPTYGCVALIGITFVFLLGIAVSLYRGLSVQEYVKLFFWGGIAALTGAKCWFMLIKALYSGNWILSFECFKESGYSFYGGLFLGLITVFTVARFNLIDIDSFSRYLLFLVPLLHAIWKLGCYMGGCCYGIKYSGIGAVVFPEGVMAPTGIKVFPIQLLEAGLLLVLAIVFLYAGIDNSKSIISKYLMCYAVNRFFVEFMRENNNRYFFSIAQWVSLLVILLVMVKLLVNKNKSGGFESE